MPVPPCCLDWSRVLPSPPYNRCLIFTEVKRPGRGAEHPPITSTGLQIGWNYTFATTPYCVGMS
jgi:hypothetical protein